MQFATYLVHFIFTENSEVPCLLVAVVELSVSLKCFPAKFSKWKVDYQMDVSDPKRKQNTVPVDGNSNENQCVRKNMSELEYYQQN